MNDIVPAGVITTFGLTAPKPTQALLKGVADKLRLMGEAGGWGEADLVEWLMQLYPDSWKLHLHDLAEFLGRSEATLRLRWQTGRTFPDKAERERLFEAGVSFEKCRLLSSYWIGEELRAEMLEKCEQGMTMRELEYELSIRRGTPQLPPPSRDVRGAMEKWLMEALDDKPNPWGPTKPERGIARYYLSLFVEWLESQ